MKFRAEPKDFLIFLGFAILLLYLVALAVQNFAALGVGTGFSMLPIKAFTIYLAQTVTFYVISLIAIIFSVSSYFFERESGFGIDLNRKDKGYSRWAKKKEMEQQLKHVNHLSDTIDAAGVPIINDGKNVWVDDSESHTLIIGSTGSGKTTLIVQPLVKLLAKKGESMIVTDPKGEIYRENYNLLKEKGYNIVLINLREPQQSNAWNPLTLPYELYKNGNTDKAMELLEDLGMNIIYDENNKSSDPFWEKTSADYFSGLALALFEDAAPGEVNLNSIGLMSTVGEDRFGPSTYIKEYFNMKDPASPAYTSAASTIMAPNETKGGIISVFKQKIKLFTTRENLSEMLSHSDFDMKDIGRKKTAVFLVIQDEKKTYHPLATTFLKQCYETLIDVAQEFPNGKLPNRTNFILDEFANMPPLKDVTTMVTAARSRSIRLNFIIQNFAQLYQVYGKENGETIKGNCGNIIYLITSELAALEEISKMCGEVKSKEKDKTASTPLVTVSDLQRMKMGETIILKSRMQPFKTKLEFFYRMDWGKKYEQASYKTRERTKIALFDIKNFVKEKKRDSVFSTLEANRPLMPRPMPVPEQRSQQPSAMPHTDKEFNVDDLIKKIDAKIAEIEAQEKEEAEKKQKQEPPMKPVPRAEAPKPTVVEMPWESKQPEEKKPTLPREVERPQEERKPIEIAPQEPQIEAHVEEETDITDDQFFDDFFGEE